MLQYLLLARLDENTKLLYVGIEQLADRVNSNSLLHQCPFGKLWKVTLEIDQVTTRAVAISS